MNIDNIKLELPSKLEDLFQFNFDNLIKIVEYLFNNNLVMIKEIKDLRTRISDLEELHSEIENIKKNNDDITKTFLDINNKISKVTEFELILKESEKAISGHDHNINNLNRVVEENVKSIKEIRENFGNSLNQMKKYEQEMRDIHQENIHTHALIENNSKKITEEHDNNNKNLESVNLNIAEFNENINLIRNNMERKNRDFDNCINSIMDTISNLMQKGGDLPKNGQNIFKLSMTEFEREKEKINSFIEEQKQNQEKKNKENEIIKKVIETIKVEIKNINIKLKNEEQNDKHMEGEQLDKINEYIKKITKSISTLPNREEFESLNRNVMARIKKMEEINSSGLLAFESKMKKGVNANNDKKNDAININHLNNLADKLKSSITNEITDNFKDMLQKEAQNLDISKNPQIMEIVKIITQHNEEINNNNKSVIDLRKTIFAVDAEKKFNFISGKLTKLEGDSDKHKKKIYQIIRTIEGNDDFEEYGDDAKYEPSCIKGKLDVLEKSYNNLLDRFVEIETRNKSITKELKEEIKSNLRIESLKTVGQFRDKLELFTRRFEEELKNKIDQMGLNNFEKKMNTKIHCDLKDKLNRHEMQKNNYIINRKIDSLESKISKTLVDTIIDLQMDEAPLIVKKTPSNMEFCASCNQYIQKERCHISSTEQNSLNGINSNKMLNNSSNNKFRKTFYGFNRTQTSMPKVNNVMTLRKELPDINKY